MQKTRNCRLDERIEEIIELNIFTNNFLSAIKKYISNGVGVRIVERINGKIWMFSLFSEDENLILTVKYNGTSHIYSEKPLDYRNQTDRDCMSINDFLVQELINRYVKKLQLEKILFRLL